VSGTVPEALLLLIQGGLPCIRLARLPRRLARLPRRHNMPSVRHAIQRHADRGPTTRAPQEQAAARDALRGRCGDNEHHSLRDTPAARPRPECALSSELARGDRLGFITKSTETQEDSHTGAGSSLAPKAIVTYDAVVPILQLIAPSRFCNLDASCGRWCTCGSGGCDVCGSRCLLSLQDGHAILCPVRASDGQLYDLSELCTYARYLARSNGTLCVLPNQVFRDVTFCRAPLFGVYSALASLLRTIGEACHEHFTHRTPSSSILVQQTNEQRREVCFLFGNAKLY
jgi:hypothetical protein